MTVFSLVIPLFVAWMVLAVIWARVIRFTPFPVQCLLGFSFFLGTMGAGYLFTEFGINKGPDDWGSMWHAGYPLSAKYGKFEDASYTLNTFEKDPDGSGSGTYRVRFDYNHHAGTILCHYDRTTGKFDHDEIIPDK
jgi:hypothetical protein